MKNKGFFLILFFTTILFFISSCGREADDTTMDDEMTSENISDQTITDENDFWTYERDYTFEQRNQFREDVNAAVVRLNEKINELAVHAANASGDTKVWYNDRIEELKEQRSEIENNMQNFDNITANAWNDFKTGITTAWNEIEESWNQIASDDRLNKDKQY